VKACLSFESLEECVFDPEEDVGDMAVRYAYVVVSTQLPEMGNKPGSLPFKLVSTCRRCRNESTWWCAILAACWSACRRTASCCTQFPNLCMRSITLPNFSSNGLTREEIL
jgi:hypothetical protein